MEKLEAKHIAPYLPYKLMFWHTKLKNKQEMSKIKVRKDGDVHVDIESDTLVYISSINDSWIKPILRPLSDLIKEIEINGLKFIPMQKILKEVGVNYPLECYTQDEQWILNDGYIAIVELPYRKVNQLFEMHFDVFGLIDKGLAISYSDVQSTSNEG